MVDLAEDCKTPIPANTTPCLPESLDRRRSAGPGSRSMCMRYCRNSYSLWWMGQGEMSEAVSTNTMVHYQLELLIAVTLLVLVLL